MSGTDNACEVCGSVTYPHVHSDTARAVMEVTSTVGFQVTVTEPQKCPTCGDTGFIGPNVKFPKPCPHHASSPPQKCPTCAGTGQVAYPGNYSGHADCPDCCGTGHASTTLRSEV